MSKANTQSVGPNYDDHTESISAGLIDMDISKTDVKI